MNKLICLALLVSPGLNLAASGPVVLEVESGMPPYSEESGYGLLRGDPEYQMTLRPDESPEPVTIKSESRRLMVLNHMPEAGQEEQLSYNVNIRTPNLEDGSRVKLNDREIGVWHWNDRLELEIHAAPGTVGDITILPAEDLVTVYIAGDSTVTDQPEEPWIGWGQMLPVFFGPEGVVSKVIE